MNTLLPTTLSPVLPENILEWTQSEVHDWLIGHNLVQISRLLSDYDGSSLIYLNKYLSNEESNQTLRLLQDDAFRRTNHSLSLVELARFRALLDQHQQILEPKTIKQKSKKHKKHLSSSCQTM